MKITVMFGVNGHKKQIKWYRDLTDFPKSFIFDGKRWEWFTYTPISKDEYELLFAEMSAYDPGYYTEMEDFEVRFGSLVNDGCECGAIYSSFGWDHMRMCKLWQPWDKI